MRMGKRASRPVDRESNGQTSLPPPVPLSPHLPVTPSPHLLVPLSLCLLVPLLVYLRTLAPGLTWAHEGGDGGDLITAAYTLGVPHPTGYPTYCLLGKLFSLLPVGEVAYRLNLLSAVSAAGAVALVYATARRVVEAISGERGWRTWTSAAVAALALAFSPVFWSQAVIAEVYALNAFFFALILWLQVRWLEGWKVGKLGGWEVGRLKVGRLEGWWKAGLGFALGVGLGNHLTLLLVVPGLLFFTRLPIYQLLIPTLSGLSIYAYIPIRAAQHPPVNWGAAHTWRGFLWLVSGALYRDYLFGLPWGQVPARLSALARLLGEQFTWVGVALGLWGLAELWITRNTQHEGHEECEIRNTKYAIRNAQYLAAVGKLTGISFLLYTIYAIGYDTTDSYVYLIPAFICFALWLAVGLERLGLQITNYKLQITNRRLQLTRNTQHATRGVLFFLLPLSLLIANFAAMDLSHDGQARRFGEGAMAVLPEGAVVISGTDQQTFALWYYQHVVTGREDMVVVDNGLWGLPWYRDDLARRGLPIPAGANPSLADFIAAVGDRSIYLTGPPRQFDLDVPAVPAGPLYRLQHE